MWTVTTQRLELMQDFAEDERQNDKISVTFTVQPTMHTEEVDT